MEVDILLFGLVFYLTDAIIPGNVDGWEKKPIYLIDRYIFLFM